MTSRCRRQWLGLTLLIAGCTSQSHHLWAELDPEEDAGRPEKDAASQDGDAGRRHNPDCPEDDPNTPPDTLECTGLYDDLDALVNKEPSGAAHSFEPAFKLWSDNAAKQRWISLPEGTQIDNSSENDWVFPVGTRVWKEFSAGGKRIETRFLWKVRSDKWKYWTYAWNADETRATFHLGGDVQAPNGPYHIPEETECTSCHNGQKDIVLGFDAISLGLPGAKGMSLAKVVEAGWLTRKPDRVDLSIGDDGTGLAAQALGYLHINCGVSCHNDNPKAKANLSGQNLRLRFEHLDGRAPDETWNPLRTVVGKLGQGIAWNGDLRIAPGDPDRSLVIRLMSRRDPPGAAANGQMPPIATRIVDTEHVDIIRQWIARLGPARDAGTPLDAGVPDAAVGMDAMVDAGADAGVDTGVDAGTPDAEVPLDAALDAGTPDAGLLDDAGLDASDVDAADVDAADVDAADVDAGDPDATLSEDAAESQPDAEAETGSTPL